MHTQTPVPAPACKTAAADSSALSLCAAPAPEPDAARRFGGSARLWGEAGAARVREAHVAVVGVGGVGSWAAEALARAGVGAITLIDLDHLSLGNTNRQLHATDAQMGQTKVLAMAQRIASFAPQCRVQPIDDFVSPENWPGLLPSGVAAVIDACDALCAKQSMAAWALAHPQRRLVCVGAAGGKRQAQRVEVADLALVSHDPLLAKLRYALRRQHAAARVGRMGLSCVFSTEPVTRPDAACAQGATDGSLNCHGYGSLVTVTATFGLVAAGLTLNALADGR